MLARQKSIRSKTQNRQYKQHIWQFIAFTQFKEVFIEMIRLPTVSYRPYRNVSEYCIALEIV